MSFAANPLFFLALGGGIFFLVKAFQGSLAKTGDVIAARVEQIPTTLKQYADPANEWIGAQILEVKKELFPEIREEEGPYGVTRKIVEGAGESWIETFGKNLKEAL